MTNLGWVNHPIESEHTLEFIVQLEALPIAVDDETAHRAFSQVLHLARSERLSAYDAAYLELAMRLGVPLASKDGPLCDAADRVGVSVLRAG
jgi:predicted nucleic acid-binding protein